MPAIGGDGRAIAPPPPTAEPRVADEGRPDRVAPPIDHRSILLDLPRLRLFDHERHLDHTGLLAETEAGPVPGSVETVYRGIHAVVVRRVLGYYRELFSDTIRDRWLGTSDSLDSIDRRIRTFYEADGDRRAGGRWWDRTWRESLVPERGGAPAESRVVTVGREIELIHLGELSLTTEAKIRVGRLSLYLDDDRIYEQIERTKDALVASAGARGHGTDAALGRAAGASPDKDKDKDKTDKPGTPTPFSDEKHIDLSVALIEDDAQVELESVLRGTLRARHPKQVGRFTTPKGNLLTGEGWNLSCHPNLQLRLPDSHELGSAISNAALELNLSLFPGETRQLWGVLNLTMTARPRSGDYSAVLTFEVLRW